MSNITNNKVLTEGWHVTSQTPVDDRLVFSNVSDLTNFGTGDQEAYRYYEGLRVWVLDERKEYEWKESTSGLLTTSFTYPNGIVSNGVNYGGKSFNFVETPSSGGGGGEVNTSSNSGAGEGLALTKVGSDLPFKSITAGTGITLTSSTDELEISGVVSTNLANADLTQTVNQRTYNFPSSGTGSLDLSGGQDQSLRLCGNVDLVQKSNSDGTGDETIRLTSVSNQSQIRIANDEYRIQTTNASSLRLETTNTSKGRIDISTGVYIQTRGTAGATSLSGPEIRFYDRSLSSQWAKFDINGKFIFGSNAFVGAEKFSIQNDTLVKGSDNSANTTGFKVINSDSTSIVDIRNNGQTCWGGPKVVNVAHIMYNPGNSSTSLLRLMENNGNVGINLGVNGSIITSQSAQTVLYTYRQSGNSWIKLYDAGVESIRLGRAGSFINGSLRVGGGSGTTTGTTGAKFEIQNASTNSYQQLFFANVRMTTTGRTNSSSYFGSDQKGFECFDTDINKKFIWNGTSWIEVGGGNNLSTADLTQTDLNRKYTRSSASGVSRLRFQGTNQVLTLEDDCKLELYNGKYDDSGAVPTLKLSGNQVDFNNGGCKIQGVGSELFIYGQFSTSNQSKIQLGANLLIEAKVNRNIELKAGTVYFNNTAGLVGSIKSDVFIWGSSYNAVGSEGFSVQKDMLVKGSDTSSSTSGFKVTDSDDTSLLDITNDGINTVNDVLKLGNLASQAGIAHKDHFNATDFALIQTAAGSTYINAKATEGLYLTEHNGAVIQVLTNGINFDTVRATVSSPTVGGILNIKPHTGAEATALTGATEGDIIMVSSTNGVFTSTGLWFFIGATWTKA